MSFVNTIKSWFGFGSTVDEFDYADAIVQEFNEVKKQNIVEEHINAPIDFVERISDQGLFHSYSTAKVSFDLGSHGNYPVELALPRFPDEESEIESFMNRLGYGVEDLPALNNGDFTVPFVKIDGEWTIDWDSVESSDENTEEKE